MTVYRCELCHTKFGIKHIFQKVKYQNMAKTIIVNGQEQTYYWKAIYCAACVKKYNLS